MGSPIFASWANYQKNKITRNKFPGINLPNINYVLNNKNKLFVEGNLKCTERLDEIEQWLVFCKKGVFGGW